MAAASTSAALAGSTGLVGSHILTSLLSHPSISAVHAYTRRDLANNSPKLHPLQSSDTSTWPSLLAGASAPSPTPALFLSALGTTRAIAGSFEAQYKIDHDLNLDLARAAKQAGCTTYVLISSGGANSKATFAYPRMKGELEDAVQQLGFEHTVILRPGLIVGERTDSHGFAEAGLRMLARGLSGVAGGALTNFWAQDREWIARAAVRAGIECAEGRRKEKGLWMLGQADIVELGREPFANA